MVAVNKYVLLMVLIWKDQMEQHVLKINQNVYTVSVVTKFAPSAQLSSDVSKPTYLLDILLKAVYRVIINI